MTQPDRAPSYLRRAAAAAALAALVAALLYLAISAIFHWYILLASVISLGVAVVAVWFILSRRGLARVLAAVVAAVALVTFIGVVIATESLVVLTIGLGLAAVSIVAASYALGPISAAVYDTKRAPRAQHPVLLMNLRSGGGKAERFGLAELCRERGIEPVILNPGDDLRQLAEDAVSRGADLLGMAGGDGSLALVASIASRHGIPFVVIPAGTRNHFALDLGLDRTDVPGALKAYEDGVDTAIDLAEVNGSVFVNNVSMGVYASIVQSADYRNAKMQTAAAMLPDLLDRRRRHSTCTSRCRPATNPSAPSCSWCPTTPTSWPSCAAEAPASVSTAARWGSSTYGSSRRPTPKSSLRWKLPGKPSGLPHGVSGQRLSSKCVLANPLRSGSTARPESSSHRYDSSAGPAR
jgi:hypothetical protein